MRKREKLIRKKEAMNRRKRKKMKRDLEENQKVMNTRTLIMRC